jgi:hypothetical protein
MQMDDPLDPATTMGPLVSRNQQRTVLSFVDVGLQEGALLALGGGAPTGWSSGAYVEPRPPHSLLLAIKLAICRRESIPLRWWPRPSGCRW